ncbi:hypothetical protein EDC01DRAFT_612298 [Geopyxis carbonaria]|nr:hypothetical protein EDC01DRAFT_612298 [Geopyxis carbonaria]
MTNSRLKAIKDNLLAGLPTLPQLPYLQQQLASFNPFSDAELPGPAVPRDGSPALEALDNVVGDVVVLGGYRGSILREKAAGNRRVWIPLKVGLNLRKIDLEVGLDPEDEERMADKIQADGMLTHIGPVDISRRLLRRLRNGAAERGRRVHEWGYDWRLSPALLTARLIAFLEQLPCNRTGSKRKGALVIAHSLGGLIVRSAVNQRPELFSGVLYAGTPTHCVNILGPLRNGDSVLLNSKVFTAQVNFTLRSSYVFLPEDGHCFVDRNTGEPIPLDFFDAGTWQALGLSPCVSDLPPPPPASTSTLPRLPIPSPLKSSASSASPASPSSSTSHSHFSEPRDRTLAPQLRTPPNTSDAPASTLPKPAAVSYLSRTLAATLSFKRSLHFRPDLADAYPPMAVLYSKTTPTVRGARVAGRAGIARADVYDDLVFGAGDGVCLARAAMLPEGYRAVVKVSVDRGHVSLLGELEGVGRCVAGLVRERGW